MVSVANKQTVAVTIFVKTAEIAAVAIDEPLSALTIVVTNHAVATELHSALTNFVRNSIVTTELPSSLTNVLRNSVATTEPPFTLTNVVRNSVATTEPPSALTNVVRNSVVATEPPSALTSIKTTALTETKTKNVLSVAEIACLLTGIMAAITAGLVTTGITNEPVEMGIIIGTLTACVIPVMMIFFHYFYRSNLRVYKMDIV